MKTDVDKILNNIANIRNSKGFSQNYMAMMLNMKQSGYGLIENGKRGLGIDLLVQIAIVFEMELHDIITYPDIYIKKDNFINLIQEPIAHYGLTDKDKLIKELMEKVNNQQQIINELLNKIK